MPPKSNAEKQARFRKKEDLKKHVNQRHREAQSVIMVFGANEYAMLAQLQSVADLPSGWTDEDLARAYERAERIFFDLASANNDLPHDVFDAHDVMNNPSRKQNPTKYRKEHEKRVEDTQALAAHLISALELTDLGSCEKAAALAEAMRHVARTLIDETPLHCSSANLLCLATLPQHYQRPDWFNASLAKWISQQLGSEEAKNDLGQKILNFNLWDMDHAT